MTQTTPVYGFPYPEVSVDPPNGAAQIQSLAEAVEATLSDGTDGLIIASVTAAGDLLTGSGAGVNAAAVTSGSDTTTSGTNVNLAGTGSVTSFSFVKRYAGTRIRLELSVSCFCQTANSTGIFGVRINAVDYDVVNLSPAPLGTRLGLVGVRYITGVGAGTWTVQGRWRRSLGTGTLVRNTEDWLTIDAREAA